MMTPPSRSSAWSWVDPDMHFQGVEHHDRQNRKGNEMRREVKGWSALLFFLSLCVRPSIGLAQTPLDSNTKSGLERAMLEVGVLQVHENGPTFNVGVASLTLYGTTVRVGTKVTRGIVFETTQFRGVG